MRSILWRCPLPFDLERQPLVHLLRWDGGNRPVRKGVAGRRVSLGAPDRRTLDGIPITSPARTWLDLAGLLPLDDLVAAADHFICSPVPQFRPQPRRALFPWGFAFASGGKPGDPRTQERPVGTGTREGWSRLRTGNQAPPCHRPAGIAGACLAICCPGFKRMGVGVARLGLPQAYSGRQLRR